MPIPQGTELEAPCSACGGTLFATVESAAHDEDLLDIVVLCGTCNRTTNAFQKLEDMTVISEGD